MNPEQKSEIARLREKSLTPKQIARKLGLKVSEVKAIVQAQAVASSVPTASDRRLPPLECCLVNEQCAQKLLDGASEEEHKRLPEEEANDASQEESNDPSEEKLGIVSDEEFDDAEDDVEEEETEIGSAGMALVTVVRRPQHNRYAIVTYLLDCWCLGVKDSMKPINLHVQECHEMMESMYSQMFSDSYREISLEQAQALVFGAVDYAAKLGFEPHVDYRTSKAFLGEPIANLPVLEFGHNGKPFYSSGPYDDPYQIIQTLEKNVGKGGFECIVRVPDPDDFDDDDF